MGLVIGIDVGWSKDRRSCAMAVMGPVGFRSCFDATKFQNHIAVGLFSLPELLSELEHLARHHSEILKDSVLVIDGPVGQHITADKLRSVDSLCSKNSFHKRAPAYKITYGSGLLLADTTEKILRTLENFVPIHPWPWCIHEDRPSRGLIVAESHPTLAMALVQKKWDTADVPSRNVPKYHPSAGTKAIRAKSDWYWLHGAGGYAASVLGDPTIVRERHHDRVAALFNLALARRMALDPTKNVIPLGDPQGTFVVSSDYDASWHDDISQIAYRFLV